MTVTSLIARTGRAALICAATLLCGSALANDLGQPQQPVVTYPHGVRTVTTYNNWGHNPNLVVHGQPLNAPRQPWEYWTGFIGPQRPPTTGEQAYLGWLYLTHGASPYLHTGGH